MIWVSINRGSSFVYVGFMHILNRTNDPIENFVPSHTLFIVVPAEAYDDETMFFSQDSSLTVSKRSKQASNTLCLGPHASRCGGVAARLNPSLVRARDVRCWKVLSHGQLFGPVASGILDADSGWKY